MQNLGVNSTHFSKSLPRNQMYFAYNVFSVVEWKIEMDWLNIEFAKQNRVIASF